MKTTQEQGKTAKAADRNPSATYTLKSFKGNITKIEKLKMATPQEITTLKTMYKTIFQRWIGGDLEF